MKTGDKILFKESFSLRNLKGTIISSLPPVNSKSFLIKIFWEKCLLLETKESECNRIDGEEEIVSLSGSFFMEAGICGTIISKLPSKQYLCEFDHPFCNIVVEEDEIVKWDPKSGFFSLLDIVRLTEDVSEHNLKKGMEGTIILVFFKPSLAYEIEFHFGEKENPEWDSFTFLPHQLEFVRSLSPVLKN